MIGGLRSANRHVSEMCAGSGGREISLYFVMGCLQSFQKFPLLAQNQMAGRFQRAERFTQRLLTTAGHGFLNIVGMFVAAEVIILFVVIYNGC